MASELLDQPGPDFGRARGLAVNVSSGTTGIVVTVDGEIDIASIDTLQTCLDHVLADAPDPVLVDLGAVTFMDSTGLAVLAATQQRLAGARPFGVRNPTPSILRILTMTGLDGLVVDQREAPPHAEWLGSSGGG